MGSSLTDAQIHRAKAVLEWLVNNEDFLLYVHQVDYHTYSNYLSKVPYPICLDMVKDRLNNGYYRQLEVHEPNGSGKKEKVGTDSSFLRRLY